MRLKPIEQQVVAVVGASSGIGRETALCFARRGAKVVAAARSLPGLESLVQEVEREGGEITAIAADVSRFPQVKAIADRAVEQYGRLDTWVHLAAVSLYATLEETEPQEFERIVQVNLLGQAYGAMAALPYLRREGRGALIHISSVEGRRALPLQSAYSASKHGIHGLADALRVELRRDRAGISVTEIIPASMNTPLFQKARTKLGVEPAPVPPVYAASIVADTILHAATHPIREIVVGGAGVALIQADHYAPDLLDALLSRLAFSLQRSDRLKPLVSPNNLFEPMDTVNRVEGDYGGFTFPFSLYTWLAVQRGAKQAALAGLAVAVAAFIGARVLKNISGRRTLVALGPLLLRRKRLKAVRRLLRV